MDKVIVTGLLVIGAITAAVVVITTMVPAITSTGGSVVESQRETARRIETNIQILNVFRTAGGDRIDVWVKNNGVAPIDAIEKSDVLLIQEGVRADRMTYSSQVATKTWAGDLKEQGLTWSRGDTLQVTIRLLGNDILTTGEYLLQFSTPNGVTDTVKFTF